MQKVHQKNYYVVSKGDASLMAKLKYWRQIEFYTLLEQVIIEAEQREAERRKNQKKR